MVSLRHPTTSADQSALAAVATKLVFQLGEGREMEFDLSARVATLGRAADNDIVVQNSWISSHHARFERIGDKVGLVDLRSHNGILLNGQRVTVAALKSGDVLTFGQLEAIFRQGPVASASPPVEPARPPATERLKPATRAAEPVVAAPATVHPVPLVPHVPAALVPGVPAVAVPPVAVLVPAPPSTHDAPGLQGPETRNQKPETNAIPPPLTRTPGEEGAPRQPEIRNEKPEPEPAADGNWEKIHQFAKGLIRRVDLLDDVLATVGEHDTHTVAQLRPLRASLIELLREFSIEPFTIEVGKTLDVATRRRIHIVDPTKEVEGVTEVAEVFRPGYLYQNGPGGSPIVLRKAEVRTGRAGAVR